jgi:hypothetical protein
MNKEYLQIGERMAIALGNPTICGLYLPAPVPDETFRDEFGFVIQSDGSVGPFYVSMGDILQTLWMRFPAAARLPGKRAGPVTGLSGTGSGGTRVGGWCL